MYHSWLIAAVIALAFLIRLWLLRSAPLIETDGVQYVWIAQRFQQSGSPFDPLFHPFYPICIAALQPFVGNYELAGRLISALFGTASLVPAYLLVRTLFNYPVAFLSLTLLAFHPGLVQSSTAVLSEAAYTFWLVLGVWTGWRGIFTPRPGSLSVAGLCFGIAYLARPEGALYLIGLLGLTAWQGIRSKRMRELCSWGGAALAGFLLFATPYLLYLRRIQGRWTLSGKVMHNLIQDMGTTAVVAQSDLGFLLHNGIATLRRIIENLFLFEKYALPELFPGLLALLLLPGLLASPRRPEWFARQGLLLGAALPPLVTLIFHVESRVFLPVLPFLLPFAAGGLLVLLEWIRPHRFARSLSIGLVVIVLSSLSPFILRPFLRPDPAVSLYHQASRWVRSTQPQDVIIMDRKPFVAFYSGHRFAPLPRVSPDELAKTADRAKAQIVILDSSALADRPELFPLLYTQPPTGLEILRDFETGPAGRLRLLKVRDHG